MEKALDAAKKLIDKQLLNHQNFNTFETFRKYSKNYLFTNENIAAYLNQIKLDDTSNALCVLASGDHPFNLISKDILNIATFDINGLTEYTALGLKRAMIAKYNFQKFQETINLIQSKTTSIDYLSETILGLLSYMEEKHRKFWQEIIDYNYQCQNALEHEKQKNIINMLCYKNTKEGSKGNIYLENANEFNRLKEHIGKANISFTQCNAATLTKSFNNKYDLIILSNILDYMHYNWGLAWDHKDLEQYLKELNQICSDKTQILLYYAFDTSSDRKIYCSNIGLEEIEASEDYSFSSINNRQTEDRVLLVRKDGNK